MKRKLGIILAIALVAAMATMLGVYLFLGRIIKTGIERVGSTVTQCPITVDSIRLQLFSGKLRIRGFVVGNPDGFNTESAFQVDEIYVELVPSSVFSDRIRIREVTVHAPQVTYELGRMESNVGRIKKNVDEFLTRLPSGGEDAAGKEPAPEEEAPGGEKKVEIDHLLVDGGKIRVSATLLRGKALSLPLPTLERRDLGKGGDGRSVAEMVGEIFSEILGSVTDVVKKSGALLKDTAKQLGDTAGKAGAQIKEGASGLLKGVKGVFGRDK